MMDIHETEKINVINGIRRVESLVRNLEWGIPKALEDNITKNEPLAEKIDRSISSLEKSIDFIKDSIKPAQNKLGTLALNSLSSSLNGAQSENLNMNVQQTNERRKSLEKKAISLKNAEKEINRQKEKYIYIQRNLHAQYTAIQTGGLQNILMIDSLRKDIIDDFFKTTDKFVEKLDDNGFKGWYKKCKDEFKNRQKHHTTLEKWSYDLENTGGKLIV